jgi:non-specific serine/threonine protein kinase
MANGLCGALLSPASTTATDRAFRIGRKKNRLVHKFVCCATVEEKIDALIESKKTFSHVLLAHERLAHELLAGSGEIAVTEMSDTDLSRPVSLDLAAAMRE